jgi:hypothetical protein
MKSGSALERIAALVFFEVEHDATVTHQVRLRSGETYHWIDVVVTRGGETRRTLIECGPASVGGDLIGWPLAARRPERSASRRSCSGAARTRAVDCDDDVAGEQPVEDGGGDGRVAEDPAPLSRV